MVMASAFANGVQKEWPKPVTIMLKSFITISTA